MAELRKVLDNGRVVVGDDTDKSAFNDAVKAADSDSAPVYPNINHPLQKGHDLIATGEDLSSVAVDGTGAHNSPNDAVKPFSTETDSNVEVRGLEEPAYKQQPLVNNDVPPVTQASDKDVAAAKKDAEVVGEEGSSDSKK